MVRYYGGTKLGVGGLIRAYGEAANLAIRHAPRLQGIPATRIVLRYPYGHTAAVMRALGTAGAAEIEHGYAEAISGGETTAAIPTPALPDLGAHLREQTAGEVRPEPLGGCTLYRQVTSWTLDSA